MLMEGPAGEDRFPLVEVWDHRDLPELPLTTPSATDKAISWLADSWQTLAMIGLAVVALLMVRGVSKIGAGAPRPDFEEGFGLELPKPPVDEMEEDDGDGGPKLTITGQHLKQELTQLVGSNPEAAANVLRKWLDGAAA
jgi:flagellar M-ring protein FliF